MPPYRVENWPILRGGHQAAHLSQGFGLGRVSRGIAHGAELLLQVFQAYAALGRDHHIDGIDFDDLVHSGTVDDDGVFHRVLQAALDGGAAGPRDHVDFIFITEGQEF